MKPSARFDESWRCFVFVQVLATAKESWISDSTLKLIPDNEASRQKFEIMLRVLSTGDFIIMNHVLERHVSSWAGEENAWPVSLLLSIFRLYSAETLGLSQYHVLNAFIKNKKKQGDVLVLLLKDRFPSALTGLALELGFGE